MATTVIGPKTVVTSGGKLERGFSLLEVVISMAILTIGLISMLGVFGIAMASTQSTQQGMIAKQVANEAMESIVTARNTSQVQWSSILNDSDGGIFLSNYQPINMPGNDGILGTADDGTTQHLTEPGPDGVYGTTDDVTVPLSNYQRKIEILPVTDVNGNVVASLRAVNVTVQYHNPGMAAAKTYVMSTFISQFR